MATLNKVMLIGRLGQDPEKKITSSGKSVISVSLASSSYYKDEMGNKQESTEWHRLVFWGNLADNLLQYTKKRLFALCIDCKLRSGQKTMCVAICSF